MTPAPTLRRDLRRIVLTGFMGSGKTTVGRALAGRLGWLFADLDDRVEASAGRTVPEIFAEHGEAAFRAAETSVLADLLHSERIVIALGGGAPGTAPVRELLANAPYTAVVHLDAPFDVLYDRCATQALDPQATARPLLGERSAAGQRYRDRRAFYAAVAHHTADAALKTPDEVATSILRSLAAAPDSPC